MNGVAAILTVVVPAVFAAAGPPHGRTLAGLGPGVGPHRRLRRAAGRPRRGRRGARSGAGQRRRRAAHRRCRGLPRPGRPGDGPGAARPALRRACRRSSRWRWRWSRSACRSTRPTTSTRPASRPAVTRPPGRAGQPSGPARYPAYAAEVSLFTAAMMLVVHADDLLLLVIGWEVMGICSYLLVGHHSEREAARRAAVKAFLVTRVGDLGMLLAVAVLLTGHRHHLDPLADRARRPDSDRPPSPRPPCCCWPRWPASRRSSRCTPGCRTRWRARPRCRP